MMNYEIKTLQEELDQAEGRLAQMALIEWRGFEVYTTDRDAVLQILHAIPDDVTDDPIESERAVENAARKALGDAANKVVWRGMLSHDAKSGVYTFLWQLHLLLSRCLRVTVLSPDQIEARKLASEPSVIAKNIRYSPYTSGAAVNCSLSEALRLYAARGTRDGVHIPVARVNLGSNDDPSDYPESAWTEYKHCRLTDLARKAIPA